MKYCKAESEIGTESENGYNQGIDNDERNGDLIMALTTIRKIHSATDGTFARVCQDLETEEYVVKFYVAGKHQSKADYFCDDLDDAIGTAIAETARTGGAVEYQD